MLVEFPSVVNAVACAADVQRKMRERNIDVPEARRIEFRVGVNLGDVIVEGDDILGDGVNVAARLEGIAPPGRSPYRRRCATMSATASILPSRTWASRHEEYMDARPECRSLQRRACRTFGRCGVLCTRDG